jgi:hypothetical protein
MRIVFLTLILSSVTFNFSFRGIKSIILPGYSSNSVKLLEDNFAKKVSDIISEMEDKGHNPTISTSFRSPEQQDFLYNLRHLGVTITKVRGGGSCHNIIINGAPSSLAVDIVDGNSFLHTKKQQAQFYLDLRDIARRKGLRSGGYWLREGNEWYEYGLGWDPGHIEDNSKCGKFRK